MPSTRLSLLQESLLWEIAPEHYGVEGLLHIVVEVWSTVDSPSRAIVDHLSTATLNQDVLSVLKIAQGRVGGFVSGRREAPGIVTLYFRHASAMADGLLERLPKKQLTRALRDSRLEVRCRVVTTYVYGSDG